MDARELLLVIQKDYREYEAYATKLNGKCIQIQTSKKFQENDIRQNIYKQLFKVVWPYAAGRKFLITELFYDSRFRSHFPAMSDSMRRDTITYYELLLRNGLIYWCSSVVESAIRSIFRALNPSMKGVGKFKHRILLPMLEDVGIDGQTEETRALDLLLEIRNSIHNNGVYLSVDKQDNQIEHRGKVHMFIYGKPHKSCSSEEILTIIQDVEAFFDKVFNKDRIRNIDFIPDVIAGITKPRGKG